MDGSAPKEVLQYVDKQQHKLHSTVATEASKIIGHPVTVADVNPHDQSPLQRIKELFGDSSHIVGSALEQTVTGTSSTTNDRITEGKVPISIAVARRLKGRFFKKAV